MRRATKDTEDAIRCLMDSLSIERAYSYDKIALAVGGDDLNGKSRFISLEFCQDISDPVGHWAVVAEMKTE